MAGKSKGSGIRTSAGHSDKKHLPADAALWEQVKKTVTPIKRPKKTPPVNKPPANKPAAKPVAAPARKSLATPPVSKPPAASPKPATLERAVLRRVTRGDDAIDARLDLHGLTQAQAHQRLVSFIARAQAKGARTVLVITGKGRLSEGGGVLKRQLPLWLESPQLAAAVLSFAPAHLKDGGSGAFYLRLRKAKK